MVATRETYKSHDIIKLGKAEGTRFPFSFGVAKAELILEHIEEIRSFVADCKKLKTG